MSIVEINLKVHDEAPIFVYPYGIKENQKPVIEKNSNTYRSKLL